MDVGAADRGRQPRIFVLRVDDIDLDAPVQAAQQLQLDQVGLARTGAPQDHAVVVVQCEAVPVHQSL